MKKCSVTRGWSVLIIVTVYSSYAYSQGGVLLNCELEGGYPDNQIYINEVEGYILYNAQFRENHERQRVYESDSGEPFVVDEGLDITANNDNFILANDEKSSFVFIKDTATFAYAWTAPVPLKDGTFIAFGNHHQGKCSVNPWTQEH